MLTPALLAWLAACSDAPRLPRLAPDAVILAFGDSLTYGNGAPRSASYPAVLERLVGRTVINAGVPGELSSAGSDRLPALLERHDPDLVILCHGGNDLLRDRPPAEIRANLRAMIEHARRHGAAVVLIGVPDKGLWLETAPLYHEVAEAAGVPLEAETLARIEGDPGLKADPIHPNRAGYRRLAQAVAALLRRAGAVESS
ncbi:MAG: arylesterase [Gammaproteobacteria bacterium]|nr:arylesterase [Gammaproteobacteria bacterium]